MTIRIYIVPMQEGQVVIEPSQPTLTTARRGPKYFPTGGLTVEPGLETLSWQGIYYGYEPVYLVATDVTTAQHTLISAKSDVLSVPANIDSNLTAGAVTVAQAFLESLHVPAHWLTTAYTYRQVLRIIGGLFQFMQYLHTKYSGSIFSSGITLDSTFSQLAPNIQSALTTAAQELNYSTTGLTANSTLRQILKNLSDQWGSQQLLLGPITL